MEANKVEWSTTGKTYTITYDGGRQVVVSFTFESGVYTPTVVIPSTIGADEAVDVYAFVYDEKSMFSRISELMTRVKYSAYEAVLLQPTLSLTDLSTAAGAA